MRIVDCDGSSIFPGLQVIKGKTIERLRNRRCTATCSEVLNPVSVILKYIDLEIPSWFTCVF